MSYLLLSMSSQYKFQTKFSVDSRPLHLRLEEAVDKLLEEFKPGDRLPSEEALSQMMGVSRATIRELLSTLEERGRVVRKHGVGTFAAASKPFFESGLETLESMDAFANRKGFSCEFRDLDLHEEPADAFMAEKLKLEIGDRVTVITRTSIVQNTLVAYIFDAMPAKVVKAEEIGPVFTGSVLDYLKDNLGFHPMYAITNLLSVEASKDLAHKLQISPGKALLLLEEFLYKEDNQLVNYSRRYYNTKYFHYYLVRRSPA